MLSKSKASPCILTLILSFVLSDYLINLMNCKLKKYISYGLVSPHLENPADFPKPVFISKGLCRDTPQLIYINVVKHLRKLKKMSNRYIILSFFLSLGLNSCDHRTQKKFFDKIVYDTYNSNYEGIITDKYIDKYNHARPV